MKTDREFKIGQKYLISVPEIGSVKATVTKELKVYGMGGAMVEFKVDDSPELIVTRKPRDIRDYRWYDEWKPTIGAGIVSFFVTILTTGLLYLLGLKP